MIGVENLAATNYERQKSSNFHSRLWDSIEDPVSKCGARPRIPGIGF
jgi:hypothetical protein